MDRRMPNKILTCVIAIIVLSTSFLINMSFNVSASPSFSPPNLDPDYPNATESVNVTTDIIDTEDITNATLYYTLDLVTWYSAPMNLSGTSGEVLFDETFPTTSLSGSNWQSTSGSPQIKSEASNEPSTPYSMDLDGSGDTIYSVIINLAGYSNVDVNFFYEMAGTSGGGGETPDPDDWLYCEYYSDVGVWEELWSQNGDSNWHSNFIEVEVVLPSDAYHSGFRFRFRSIGSGSNMDDMYLDDIKLISESSKAEGLIPGPGYSTWVYYYINATNQIGENGTSGIYSYYADGTKPAVLNLSSPIGLMSSGNNITITTNVTDDHYIDYTLLWYNNGSGWTSSPMSFISGNSTNAYYGKEIPASGNETTVLYFIEIFDKAGNSNVSITHNYTTNFAPVITNISLTPQYPNGMTSVTVHTNVTDLDGVSSVSLSYSTDGTLYTQTSMNFIGGDIYEGTVPATGFTTAVYYYIRAADNNSVFKDSAVLTYLVDADPPGFDTHGIDPEYPNATVDVNVTFPITDNINVTNATLWYSYNGSTWLPVDMDIGAGAEPPEIQSLTGPTTLSCNYLYWDTVPGGYIGDGGNDAYDNGYYLQYLELGTYFFGPAYLWEGYNSTLGEYREILFQPEFIGTLEFSRKLFAPWEGYWARYVDTIYNPTGTDMTITVQLGTNLGSGGSSVTWAVEPYWAGTDDNDGTGDPSLAHVFGPGGNGTDPSGYFNIDYPVTIPAGSNISLVTFAIKTPNRASAQSIAWDIADNFESCDSVYSQNLSLSEMEQVVNWNMDTSNQRFGSVGTIPGPGYSTWVYYYVNATDRANNINTSMIYKYYADGTPPIIIETSNITSPKATNSRISIFANITDDYGFSPNNVYLRYDNGSGWTSIQMNFISGNYTNATFQAYIPATNIETTVSYYVEVFDNASNANSSVINNYLTNSPPSIENVVHLPEYPNGTVPVTIYADITDSDGINSAVLYYSTDGFTYIPSSMSVFSGDIFNGTIPPIGLTTTVYYYINATDSNGFQNSSPVFTYYIDTELPEFGIPSIDPEFPNATDDVNVSIIVSDNTQVNNGTLFYRYGTAGAWNPVLLQGLPITIGGGQQNVIVAVYGGGNTDELIELNQTLDVLGFSHYNVNNVDEAVSLGANIIIDYPGGTLTNGPTTSLSEFVSIYGNGYIQLSDWGRDLISNSFQNIVGGTSVTVTIEDINHPVAEGLPNSWTTYGFWRYGLSTDYCGWSTSASSTSIAGAQASGDPYHTKGVAVDSMGEGRLGYAGHCIYGSDASSFDEQLFENLIFWVANASKTEPVWAYIPGPGYSTWVYYYINAADSAGNFNVTIIHRYYVDATSPVIADTSDVTSPVATNTQISIFANITDDHGFSPNNVYLWYDNGSGWTGVPMNFVSGNYTDATFQAYIPAVNNEVTVFYYIQVTDNASNINISSTKSYLTDFPPFIQNISNLPVLPNGTTPVTVSADIFDNDGISSATLYYSQDGMSYTPAAMTNFSGNTYNGTIPAAGGSSIIYFYIKAVDNNGFENDSLVYNYSIDNEPPNISVPVIDPQYPNITDPVNVTFQIYDEGDIDTATLFYSYNGTDWLSTSVNILGKAGGILFNETFPSSSINWSNWASTVSSPIISTQAFNEPTPPYSLELDASDDTITSVVIDIANTYNTTINFSYQMGGGGNPPESSDWLYLDYYTSGGSWFNLWSQNGDGMSYSTFDKVGIPLPPDAYHANFQFRFRSWGSSGDDFYVDDITLFAGANAYAHIPGPGNPSMVYYYISIIDGAGNAKISDQYSYLAGSDLILTPQDITFSPFPLENGSAVTINTVIYNSGGNLVGVEVRFYQGNPDMDLDNIIDVSAKEIGTPAIISIGSNGLGLVSVQWVPPGIGTYDVYVWVDPINSIMEFDEWNNVAAGTLSVFCWVDTFDNSTKTESKQNITYQFGDAFIGQNMLDGKNWTKQGMVMDIGSPGEPDDMFIYKSTVLREDDGTYKILYAGYDGGYYRIMYAESPDGIVWTKFGVAIDLGSPGAPDDVGVDNPAVIIDKSAPSSERYKMWYAGDDGSDYHVMYATSHNARTWTRQGVVMNQGPGTYDYYDIRPSMVIKTESGTYKMWYQGYDGSYWRICYATSPDGVTWTKQGVVLDIGPSGSMDDRHVYGPSIIIDPDNNHHMWYYGSDGSRDRIFYAVSSDGITWLKHGFALDLGPGGSYDDYHVSCPTVIKENDGFHKMWYSGYDGSYRRLMYATLSPDSKENYHYDFDTSDEGFILESNQPNSAVYWDSFMDNVYFRADRRDSNDEMYVKYLYENIDEDSGSWTLSARFQISSGGSYQRAIPLFMGDMSNTNIHDVPNTINFYYYSQFGEARARYYDSTGTSRIYISQNINQNTEYHVRAVYDMVSKNLKLQILDENDVILKEDSYIIGTNPSDNFIFGKFGVGTEGISGSYYPYCTGWTDDINFTFMLENGILVSDPITLPPDRAWYELHVDKEEPGSTQIKITIVDPVSGTPIPGYADLTGAVIDISGISWLSYPSIKLMAHFMGNSQVTPILHHWAVNWVPPVIADAGHDDSIDEDIPYVFDASGSWSSVDITNYAWDIDAANGVDWSSPDYQGPDLINPTHTYSTPGVYLVTLNVTDINGYWDISTVVITVNDITPPDVDAGPDDIVDEDSPYTFDASGSQDNSGTIVSYLWDIDASDGVDWSNPDYTGTVPVHTFFEPGIYIVTLNLSDTAGNWNITSITVTVRDITPPIAEAGQDGSINEDDTFSFNGSASADNVDIIYYNWSFGDGNYDFGTNITTTHTYPVGGSYTATLMITDFAGNSDEDSLTINVNNLVPIAEAGPNQTVNESEVVILDGSDTWDTPSDIPTLNYIWYFGDGFVGAGSITTHTYNAPGEYIVTLIVTDDNGATVNDNLVIFVFDGSPPTANAYSDGSVDQNTDYQFDGSYSSDNVGISYYAWDMDASDGIDWENPDYSGTDTWNPVHSYSEPGMYTISLNVTDTSGHWDLDTMVLTVIDSTPPVGDAGLDGQTEQNMPYTFNGRGSSDNIGIVTYLWDIDSSNGIDWSSPDCIGQSPTYIFVEPGLYIVTIRVVDAEGNIDEDTVTITVNETMEFKSAPNPPTDIEVLLLTRNDALQLKWNPPATNQDGSQLMDLHHYEIHYRAGENSEFKKLSTITAGTSSYTHSGLTCNAIYYYYIIAVNSNSTCSEPSITVSGMPNLDTDGDQIPDINDLDNDNDGHPDSDDAYPLDSTKWEKPETGYDWLWVLIGLVVVLLCIIVFMLWRDYREAGSGEELPDEPSKVFELEEPPEEPQKLPMEPIPEGTFGQLSGETLEEPQEYSYEEMHDEIPMSPPEALEKPPEQPEGIAPAPSPILKGTGKEEDVGDQKPGKDVEWQVEEEPAITPIPQEENDTGKEPKQETAQQTIKEKSPPPRPPRKPKDETAQQTIKEKRRPPRPPSKQKIKVKKKMMIKKNPET
jgi:hypothetical protein